MDAGGAIQGIDFEAGIVGEDVVDVLRVAVGDEPVGERDGFLGGVAGEVGSVFDDAGGVGKISEGEIFDARAEDAFDFLDFVLVVGGDEQLHFERRACVPEEQTRHNLIAYLAVG